MRALSHAVVASLLAAAGCSISAWSDYESRAAIDSLSSSAPFPPQTFGTLLGAYRTSVAGVPVSRLVIGTGRGTVEVDGLYGTYSFWQADHLDLGRKIYTHCNGSTSDCPEDAGATLAPIPDAFGGAGCVLAGAPTAAPQGVLVSCEDGASHSGPDRLFMPATPAADAGALLGSSLAAVPTSAPHVGLALVGAPGSDQVWVLGATLSPFEILGTSSATGQRLGSALATAPITTDDAAFLAKLPPSDERALVAISAPGENRLYLALARGGQGVTPDAIVVACVDDPAAGTDFANVLTAGDLDGDGIPEVVVGSNLLDTARGDEIRIVSLADVDFSGGTAHGCTDPTSADDPTTRVVGCGDPDDPGDDDLCLGFGASLAIGNVNRDGYGDLLVGTPLATVGNVSHAGAAYLLPGDPSLDVVASTGARRARLVDSRPEVSDTLGIAVTFVASQLDLAAPHDEPVAAAPGANRIFVFFCTGIPNDSVSEAPPRCFVQE